MEISNFNISNTSKQLPITEIRFSSTFDIKGLLNEPVICTVGIIVSSLTNLYQLSHIIMEMGTNLADNISKEGDWHYVRMNYRYTERDVRIYECFLFPIVEGKFECTYRARFGRVKNSRWWWSGEFERNDRLVIEHVKNLKLEGDGEYLSRVFTLFREVSSGLQDPSTLFPLCFLACHDTFDKKISVEVVNLISHIPWIQGTNLKRIYMSLFVESVTDIPKLMDSFNHFVPIFGRPRHYSLSYQPISTVTKAIISLSSLALPTNFYSKLSFTSDSSPNSVIPEMPRVECESLLIFELMLNIVNSLQPAYVTPELCHFFMNLICRPISPQSLSYLIKIMCSLYSKPQNLIDSSRIVLSSILDSIYIYCYHYKDTISDCVKYETYIPVDNFPSGNLLDIFMRLLTHIIKITIGDASAFFPFQRILSNPNNLRFITKALLHLADTILLSHPDYIRILENLLLITKHSEIEINYITTYLLQHWPFRSDTRISTYYRFFTSASRIMKSYSYAYSDSNIDLFFKRILFCLQSDNLLLIQTTMLFLNCNSNSFLELTIESISFQHFLNDVDHHLSILLDHWNGEIADGASTLCGVLHDNFHSYF